MDPRLVMKFLKSPLAQYIINVLILALSVFAIYWYGGHVVQVKWDAEKKAIAEENAKKKDESVKVTEKIVIKYVDRVKVIKEKGDEIIKYVDRYVTKDDDANCTINYGFIRMYDDAIKGNVPNTSSKTDGSAGRTNTPGITPPK